MIVALTGVILMLFVIGHLLGNLQIFLGPRWVNDYAQHLRDLGPLLCAVRITLLVAVFLHIYLPSASRSITGVPARTATKKGITSRPATLLVTWSSADCSCSRSSFSIFFILLAESSMPVSQC